jgi:DNA-binding PadR family transcriptional regulator
MPRTNLGELEEQVLLLLLRLGETHAVAVAEQLEALTGRSVSAATTFMVMRRLESRGLVTSRVEPERADWGGRPRRFYKARQRAVVPLLRASRHARLSLWRGLERLLDGK